MWPFASCGYSPKESSDELTQDLDDQTQAVDRALSPTGFSEDSDLVVMSPGRGDKLAAVRVNELSSYIFCSAELGDPSFAPLEDPRTPRISCAHGDTSPSRIRSPSRRARKESTAVPIADPGLQDYASATIHVDDTFVAESRLHAWLLRHGLGHHYGAIHALGAKKISDLTLLTHDDMDDLGLTQDERKLFNIRIAA